ncbi:hypothetical protein RSAG8_05785, partial [Rhizoctonia solani AG-8 WAC10335]
MYDLSYANSPPSIATSGVDRVYQDQLYIDLTCSDTTTTAASSSQGLTSSLSYHQEVILPL